MAALSGAADALAADELLAVAISGDPPPPRERSPLGPRLVRRGRLLLAGARAAARAGRAETALRRAGLTTRRLGIGDRSDGYEIALSGPRARRAPEQVVVAGRGRLPPTLLEQIVDEAGESLAARLQTAAVRVLSSGTLMADVTSGDDAFVLRVEPRAAAAVDPLTLLLACEPPPAIAARLVVARLRGTLAGHPWSIEPRRPGLHPRAMTAALWEDCTGFLEALATVAPPADRRAAARTLHEDLALVQPLLGREPARRLGAAIEPAVAALERVPRGWGHGDFHPGNLLVDDGLATVLDWDAAAPDALPLLDVLHLHATTAPATRRSPHGVRCREVLWPLARAGGDARMHEHCAARGVDPDPHVLEALAIAYWLTRVARDLLTFPDRAGRPAWLALNVVEPARDLTARG